MHAAQSHGEKIGTRVVPTEGVRLVRQTVIEQQTIWHEVRKEDLVRRRLSRCQTTTELG